MEDIKIFSRGLNSDLSPVFQQENTYTDSLNIELVNDENQGSIAVSNSKGNKFQMRLTDTAPIRKITLNSPGFVNVTIDFQSGSGVNATGIKDLYDYINSDPAYTFLNERYRIYYSNKSLFIYPLLEFGLTVSVTGAGIVLENDYIPAQANIKIIGYGIIRDNIYLFATSNTSVDPKVTNDGYGFIYKISYNNITFDSADTNYEIIYAANLNFTTYYNIPQTAVIGRYENDLIQRLYWTDNYNKLRSLNVVDPQVGAIDVNLLNIQPFINMNIPILRSITSAPGTTEIEIGSYQLAYKLSNLGGGSTLFSIPSNPVFVVDAPEENQNIITNWKDYRGDIKGTKTTKRIVWKIDNLDQNFSRIEAIVLFKDSKNAVPTISSFYEGSINSDSIEISFDGNILNSANTTTVTLEEYTQLSNTFTHCKTIGTKDNRLLAGNVRNEISEISNLDYDARVYRFDAPNNFKLIQTLGNPPINYTTSDYGSILENVDAINPFNLLNTDPNYSPNSKYKADGVTVGGSGPNISYEFVSMRVKSDNNKELTIPQSLPLFSTSSNPISNKLFLNVYSKNKSGLEIPQEYYNLFPDKINDGTKFPQMNSVLWGYQHNEIYRIGIQFYDKSSNPYFTKWIGDIKFPDYFDTCPALNNIDEAGNPTGITDYRISDIDGTVAYTFQLGIKFNIRIPAALSEKISGYSIVRVKREEADKTVVAEGIVSNTMRNVAPFSYKLPSGTMDYYQANNDLTRVNFLTPNMLDSSLAQPGVGMKLRISSFLQPANANTQVSIAGGTGDVNNYIYKLYNQSPIAPYEANINYSSLMALNGYTSYLADNYNNFYDLSGTSNIGVNNGNPAYLFVLNSNIPVGSTSGNNRFLAYVYNPIINQYGGNTYISRSLNEYILCSHFRGIQSSIADYIDSPLVYGGDVINGLMDEERVSKDFTSRDPLREFSTTFIYPSKSPVNRELRHGRHPNISLTDVVTNNNERTDYYYNTVYSTQNDTLKFNIKPYDLNLVSNYDNRFYISEIKINGELVDSWSIFKANNYWDVDGTLGPINSCLLLGDKMYFWQDRGFGIVEINPRTLINDAGSSTNSQITTGSGLPLQGHEYISTVVGTKHQGSTLSSSNKLFWFDVNTKKIYTFNSSGPTPFSDVEGMYSYLNKNIQGNILNVDKPTYDSVGINGIGNNGVVATYDYKRHKAIFTFHSGINTSGVITQKSFTVAINELLNCFTTRYSFTPKIYINDYKVVISTDNRDSNFPLLSDLYIHDVGNYGEFYGLKYPSYLKFIVNKNPQITKVFDNFRYDSQARVYNPTTDSYVNFNDDTWTSIRVTNDYQNTDTQTLIVESNIKRRERTWQLAVPRNRVLYSTTNSPNIYTDLSVGNKPFGERIRDKYIQVELTYDNISNCELITNNFITQFRQSSR